MAGQRKWQRPSDDELVSLLNEHGTREVVSQHLGIPSPTVRHWYKDAERRLGHKIAAPATGAAVSVASGPEPADLLRQENRELKAALRKANSADVKFERLINMFAEAIEPIPQKIAPPKPPNPKGHTYTQVGLLSDTHAGEVVNPSEINGLNEYNWQIMEDRLAAYGEGLLSHRDHHVGEVSELQLWVLGDMLSGENHEELAITNEVPIADQCWKFGNRLSEFISGLAPYYPRIKVCGVVGNHPRTTRKPANKQVFNNFDWLAYKIAGLKLADTQNVECRFPRAGSQIVEVAGKNAFLFHGDGIRSSMPGVPWGGVMRRWNEIKKGHAEQGILLHYLALGHFHQANIVQGQVFMNGAVKGTDEYVQKNFGAGERPRQVALHFSDRHQRLTGAHFIDL